MADHTFASGEVLTASNTNTYLSHTGGAFNTWVPVVTQAASTPSLTIGAARYHRAGRLITFQAIITVTSAGTAGAAVIITLPVTGAATTATAMLGNGVVIDVSAATDYSGPLLADTTTTCAIGLGGTSAGGNNLRLGQVGFTAALANGDFIKIGGQYEAAAG